MMPASLRRKSHDAGELAGMPQSGLQGNCAALRKTGQHDPVGGDPAGLLFGDQRLH
jgi:hypothetical protein